MGVIATYQKCPRCGGKFNSSKGLTPVQCPNCLTQPTKFHIILWWKGRSEAIYVDRKGQTIHHFSHAVSTLGEIRAEIDRGSFDPQAYKRQSKSSFKKFWQRFTDTYQDRPGTRDKLKAVSVHLSDFMAYQMRDITPLVIDNWWRDLQSKNLSQKYCNDILQWLKSLFKQAHELAVIEAPIRRWPEPFSLPGPEINDWLSRDEQAQILDALPSYDQPIFEFLFRTGVRVNEATGLQRSDINWQKRIITIRHTRKRDGSLGITKNRKPRIIPLVDALQDCLKVSALSPYQFLNKWGRPYSDDYLRDTFNRVCQDVTGRTLKLKNATRSSWGMNLIAEGVDPYKVSKGYGHSDMRITEHYAQIVAREFERLYEEDKPNNSSTNPQCFDLLRNDKC